jgi:ankyrin repeat protein
VVRLLVKRNDVNADSKDGDGRKPLWYATRNGHKTVVRVLVERDEVKTESKDKHGRTPL